MKDAAKDLQEAALYLRQMLLRAEMPVDRCEIVIKVPSQRDTNVLMMHLRHGYTDLSALDFNRPRPHDELPFAGLRVRVVPVRI